MKYPLGPVTLLFIAGIVLGQWAPAAPGTLLPIAFIASGVALVSCLLNWNRICQPALAAAVLLAGWTGMACHTAILSPNDLRLLLDSQPADVTIQGTIAAPPAQRIFERDGMEMWRSTVVVEARQIMLAGVWRPAFGKIVVATPGVLPETIFAGQNAQVAGIIAPPREAQAQGLFSPRRYYLRQDIYFGIQADSPASWSVVGNDSAKDLPVSERFTRWARQTLSAGLPVEDEAMRLLWTLVLDWKPSLTASVEEPFMRAGT